MRDVLWLEEAAAGGGEEQGQGLLTRAARGLRSDHNLFLPVELGRSSGPVAPAMEGPTAAVEDGRWLQMGLPMPMERDSAVLRLNGFGLNDVLNAKLSLLSEQLRERLDTTLGGTKAILEAASTLEVRMQALEQRWVAARLVPG